MRILLISGEFPPMQGGVGDYTRQMARAFAAQGHEAHVLASASLAEAYRTGTGEPWGVHPVVDAWGWRCWRQVAGLVREVVPDVIDIQYQAAAYDMRIPAIHFLPWWLHRTRGAPPVVVTYHDLKPPYLFPKAGPLRGWVVRQLARHCHAAIVTNAEDLNAARQWPSAPSLHHIPIGSNMPAAPPAGYDRAAWRTAYGYGEGDFVWAYFGFLNESKGGETLVQALALSPPHHRLLMIGDRVGSSDPTNRSYAARVEASMTDLGVIGRVQWTGYLAVDQVPAALLGADVVVLPYRDGISFRRGSLHAALALGCPVLSTYPRVPLPELIDGENVRLVPVDDSEALSLAARELAHDPAVRARIGGGAKLLARQFTWERIAQRTVDEVFRPLTITTDGHR